MDWKTVVNAVAPTVATALGGPLAGAAVSALSSSLLGKPDGTADEVAAAITGGGPDMLLKMKQADQTFAEQMKSLDIDLAKLAEADRDSARQREVQSHDSTTPRVLALVVTLGFFSCLGYMLVCGKPPTGGDALLVMLGALGGAWAAIISYYFGSMASPPAPATKPAIPGAN
jgi:hypothetical protein